MAVYEFRCTQCGYGFEVFRPMSEFNKPAQCPKCGSKGERLISDFASNQGSTMQVPSGDVLREPAAMAVNPTPTPTRKEVKIKAKARKTKARRATLKLKRNRHNR